MPNNNNIGKTQTQIADGM